MPHTHILIGFCAVSLVSKESAGAVDEDDFIKAFTDVPTVQVHNTQFNNNMMSSHIILDHLPEKCSLFHMSAPLLFLLSASMQIYSTRDLEDNLNKIREVCSDDKHDWDQRANAVSRRTFSSLFSSATITTFFLTMFPLFDHLRCLLCLIRSWRRSAHCWWREQPTTTVFTSTYGY